MITKYRNRAAMRMAIAAVLTVLAAYAFYEGGYLRGSKMSWNISGIIFFGGAYIMWIRGSITLARARGYHRIDLGTSFAVLCLVGLVVPILPLLLPLYILQWHDRKKFKVRQRQRFIDLAAGNLVRRSRPEPVADRPEPKAVLK
jgi:hypothetical protein